MNGRRIWVGLFVFVLILTACSVAENGESQEELTHIRLPMGYIPNIQYAPFYVAQERGYFRSAGLEIEFDYSFETDGIMLVGAGELPFAIVSGEQVLLARDEGLPIVYVMAWWQDYPVAVAAKTESGIQSPTDLVGKKVGLPGLFGASYVGLRALLDSAGVAESDLTLDSIGYNQVEALAVDQEDAVVIYVVNEPIHLRAQGYEINVIAVADYVQLASNGIITNESTIADNPELVQAMVSAFRRGLEDTIANPWEAYRISINFVEGLESADERVQREILDTCIELWKSEPLGYIDVQAWENMQEVLLNMGSLSEALNVSEALTNQFVSD